MFLPPFDSAELYAELHSRPSPIVEDGALLVHYAVLHGGTNRLDYAHLDLLFQSFSQPLPKRIHCIYHQFSAFELRYERHQEYTTYTLIGAQNLLQTLPELQFWLDAMPGQHLVQTHCICLVAKPRSLAPWFGCQRACASRVASGAALVYTSFELMPSGASRYLIVNEQLNSYQLGRLAQRLLELETYRLLALVTLPLARTLLAKVQRFDGAVARTNRLLATGKAQNLSEVLNRLVAISAQLHSLAAHAHYRIEATNAYYGILQQRLVQLREVPLAEHQSLTEFLERRLAPGVATCKTAGRRLNSVMGRVSQTADLVAAKLSVQMTIQNQNLLAAMNHRGKVQLQVQLALESLSVAAIAYYGMGLLGYIFAAVPQLHELQSMKLALAISVPLVLLSVVWFAGRLRRQLRRVSEGNTHGID